MNTVKTIGLSILLLTTVYLPVKGQNLEELMIERLNQTSYTIPERCNPENLIIVINSSIPDLKFESNMLPDKDFIVQHSEATNQWIICHQRMKFKLTISGSNIKSEDIDIFDVNNPHYYNVAANTVKGKVSILTNPKNSTVLFPGLNNLAVSSSEPIVNVSGTYRITIVKPNYKSIDTSIVIPRNGEETYKFDLVPEFARLKLLLNTDDKAPFVKAPVVWIDSTRIELDALVKPGLNQRSFFDALVYFRFYEGNYIPLPEGSYNIKILVEGYNPYETTVQTKKGKVNTISVNFEPVFGFITFKDKQNAEGTKIFLNEVNVGTVPSLKLKARVGNNNIRFEKPGFVPIEKEYSFQIQEKQSIDFDVVMQIARKINIVTEPSKAEVISNGELIGFTPFSVLLNEGVRDFLIKKSGYASEKFEKQIDINTPDEETVKFILHSVSLLRIKSERDGLTVGLQGLNELKNIEIDNSQKTPASIQLPFGKYLMSLNDGKKVLYKSKINHSPDIISLGKFPVYSKSSFHILTGNYYLYSNKKTGGNNLNFDASLGRIIIFPGSGLSTAIINAEYKEFSQESIDSLGIARIDTFRTIAPYVFFFNWEWRLGGSIFRQLDLCLLGQAKYTPGFKIIKQHIPDFEDVTMQKYFIGAEISTRLSYFNINLRVGQQFYNGKINVWDKNSKSFNEGIPIKNIKNDWVVSAGLTLNGIVYKSNNMLRLWNQPFVNLSQKKTLVVKNSDNNIFRKIFSKKK